MTYLPRKLRRFPVLVPVTLPVNLDDAERWPEITRAIDHARALREGRNGG